MAMMHLDPKTVVEHLDPRAAIEHLDPKAMLERVDPKAVLEHFDPKAMLERVDPKAVLERIDPRHKAPPKRNGGRGRLALLVIGAIGGVVAAVMVWRARRGSAAAGTAPTDTATGTDPNAKYDHAGYEDKSLGQAVNADMELVDSLVEEEHGDLARAEDRFQDESAGAPALHRQAGAS